jgi:hypothetical protein
VQSKKKSDVVNRESSVRACACLCRVSCVSDEEREEGIEQMKNRHVAERKARHWRLPCGTVRRAKEKRRAGNALIRLRTRIRYAPALAARLHYKSVRMSNIISMKTYLLV